MYNIRKKIKVKKVPIANITQRIMLSSGLLFCIFSMNPPYQFTFVILKMYHSKIWCILIILDDHFTRRTLFIKFYYLVYTPDDRIWYLFYIYKVKNDITNKILQFEKIAIEAFLKSASKCENWHILWIIIVNCICNLIWLPTKPRWYIFLKLYKYIRICVEHLIKV